MLITGCYVDIRLITGKMAIFCICIVAAAAIVSLGEAGSSNLLVEVGYRSRFQGLWCGGADDTVVSATFSLWWVGLGEFL